MCRKLTTRTPALPARSRTIIVAALLALWASSCQAGQSNKQFTVFITLQNNRSAQNGICRSSVRVGVFGETVTVVCSTGEAASYLGDIGKLHWSAVQDGEYRFVTIAPKAGEFPNDSGNLSGMGTVTSWRLVSISNHDYLELMIGW